MPHKIPPEKHKFGKNRLPTPEERKKAQETRKLKLRLKPLIRDYMRMSIDQITKIQKDMKKNPRSYTWEQLCALSAVNKIAKDFKYYKDHRDRDEGMATQRMEHAGPGGTPIESVNYNVTEKDAMKEYLRMIKGDE